MKMVNEKCIYCENVVSILSKLEKQKCPKCGKEIFPCSICKDKNCKRCTLDSGEMISLCSYNGELKFSKKWLEAMIFEHFDLTLEKFIDNYTYDDVQYLENI